MPDNTAPPPGGSAERPVALITGASSGIGAAVAARLASDGGWHLLLSGRDEARLAAVADATSGTALPLDLAEPGAPELLAEGAIDRAGRIDLLVAAAGLGWAGPFPAMPATTLDRLIAVNLTAVLHLVRLLLPGMVRRRTGHIVLIGSIAGRVGVREEAVYCATKAALTAFADSLRYELVRTGVRVSVVQPGAVDTPYFDRRGAPYRRTRPRPVPAARVAEAVRAAVAHGRGDVFVPPWLGMPARVHGAAPGLFRRLATRFG